MPPKKKKIKDMTPAEKKEYDKLAKQRSVARKLAGEPPRRVIKYTNEEEKRLARAATQKKYVEKMKALDPNYVRDKVLYNYKGGFVPDRKTDRTQKKHKYPVHWEDHESKGEKDVKLHNVKPVLPLDNMYVEYSKDDYKEEIDSYSLKPLLNIKKGAIKLSTLKSYLGVLNKLYKGIVGGMRPPNDFEWLEDFEYLREWIDSAYPLKSTKQKIVSSIASVLGRFDGTKDSPTLKALLEKYRNLNGTLIAEYNDERKENKLTERQKEKSSPWEKFQEKTTFRPKYMKRDNYLLYLLLTKIPPRRPDAVSKIRVFYRKPKDDKGLNYILLQKKNNKFKQLVLRQWKNFSSYGTYKTSIPYDINKFIYKHYKEPLVNGSLLFPNFTNYTDAFKNIRATKIDSHTLRRSYASYWFRKNPKATDKRVEEEAEKMGHSAKMFRSYRVVV